MSLPPPTTDDGVLRQFDTGATRDTATGKYEYARFFDPKVLEARAAYMHKHRLQSDGTLRDPDNWKAGIPAPAYVDSLLRHVIDVWLIQDYGKAVRPETGEEVDLKEALCAIMFNAEGLLYELVRDEGAHE